LDVWDEASTMKDVEFFCLPVAAYEDITNFDLVFDGIVLTKAALNTFKRIGLVEGISQKWLNATNHSDIILA